MQKTPVHGGVCPNASKHVQTAKVQLGAQEVKEIAVTQVPAAPPVRQIMNSCGSEKKRRNNG